MSGNLTDEQLKEFDAYLNGAQPMVDDDDNDEPIKPLPHVESEDDDSDVKPKIEASYLEEIVDMHGRKADDIMKLLDKIDAKAHKDIVADLVDEMQYQKGVMKRETEQLGKLKQLFTQAAEAIKK